MFPRNWKHRARPCCIIIKLQDNGKFILLCKDWEVFAYLETSLGTCSNTSHATSWYHYHQQYNTYLQCWLGVLDFLSKKYQSSIKGELSIVLVYAQRELRFQNIQIGDDYCGQYDVNHQITGPEPVQSQGILSFNRSASSIIAFPAQNGETIIFLGLQEGTIKKVFYC